MGEKRGSTAKIIYDFPTEKDCQVWLSSGRWHRTTPKDFRSWGANRRIVYHVNGEQVIEEYNGPIYYWNTNIVCKEPIDGGVQFISSMPRQSIRRATENRLVYED
jgi:hypothetical protein